MKKGNITLKKIIECTNNMNLNEHQAIEMAKKVFKDIDFEYYYDVPLKASYDEDEKFLMHPQVKNTWTVVCKWFDPDWLSGRERSGFLIIDDAQEPVVLLLRTGGGGNCVIQKDEKGKYYVEKNY